MIPVPAGRTCAVCGTRDAVEWTDLDGRRYAACQPCLRPPRDIPHDEALRIAAVADRGRAYGSVRQVRAQLERAGADGISYEELLDLLRGSGGAAVWTPRLLKKILARLEERGNAKRRYDSALQATRWVDLGDRPTSRVCRADGCDRPGLGPRFGWRCADHRRAP